MSGGFSPRLKQELVMFGKYQLTVVVNGFNSFIISANVNKYSELVEKFEQYANQKYAGFKFEEVSYKEPVMKSSKEIRLNRDENFEVITLD